MDIKTLLIVYQDKDKEFFKHLKNLIESKDDEPGNLIGVEDGTVRVFKCSDKKWLEHKGTTREKKLADKVLFIDDIRDVELSAPEFKRYGISYGQVDRTHYAVIVDEKYVWNEEEYKDFRIELMKYCDDSVSEMDAFAAQERAKREAQNSAKFAAFGLLIPASLILTGGLVAKNLTEAKKKAEVLRKQMLYYAINKVYREELDSFMKQ